jgi:hypothetical protein
VYLIFALITRILSHAVAGCSTTAAARSFSHLPLFGTPTKAL